jgi:hypothetical protein
MEEINEKKSQGHGYSSEVQYLLEQIINKKAKRIFSDSNYIIDKHISKRYIL